MNHLRLINHTITLPRGVTVVAMFLTLVFTTAIVTTAQGADWDIPELMSLLAQNKGGQVTYTEKKYISILDMPLVSTGELIFKPPSHLEKRTLTPKQEGFILDGNTMTIEHDQQKRIMQLQDFPRVGAIIESIRSTLAGDQTALERSYRLVLKGTQQKWTLTLQPVNQQLSDFINNIQVVGEHGQIRSIEINQIDGDYSVMTINKSTTP
jgi:outer membrane lipoprotein-sorting protein